MIVKFFNLNEKEKNKFNLFLFYGENEGQKEEVINKIFLKDFKGEIIKYDEKENGCAVTQNT